MIKNLIKKVIHKINDLGSAPDSGRNDIELLAFGAMLSKQQFLINSDNINDYEFKIFSQWGDDGIIQYLIKSIEIENETFIEFGVENYLESNTRFLMMNNNWSGFVMDSSKAAMDFLKNQKWYWKYGLMHKAAFIDKDNINNLLAISKLSNIGLLHIDIDGNDYHVLKEINLSKLNPSIIIMEYNSVFGKDRLITVPYNKNFTRTNTHYSNLFFGASLPAFDYMLSQRQYSLIGSNLAGNNAYFIRNDLLNDKVKKLPVEKAYKESKFRESRNKDYSLSFLEGKERFAMIKGLEVLNVKTNKLEKL